MVFPDYDRSILSITASVLNHFGAPSGYPSLPELDEALAGRRKVLWVIADGLGSGVLRRTLPESAWLRRNTRATVTSVFPPTTTAATTSYYTGKSPMEHGWLGWHMYFKECATDVTTFTSTGYYTKQRVNPAPAPTLLPYESLFEHIRRAAPEVKLHAALPFPTLFERAADVSHRISTLEQGLSALRRAAEGSDDAFALIYWTQPDADMHDYGVDSSHARAQYRAVNDALERLSAQLFAEGRDDTLLLVSSDHGLTDMQDSIDLADDPEVMDMLVMPPSLEARAAAFWIKPHRREDFARWFRENLAEDFILMFRGEVLENGLFGRGVPHRKFDDFIGDALVIAVGARCIDYTPPGQARHYLKGRHAGLTADEMWVDVIIDTGSERS